MNQVNKRATLPVGFPPPPDLGDFNAKTEEEYKAYMKRKLLREQWDNSLVLYRMKEKAGDPEGMRQVLARISNQIKVSDLNSERAEHSDGQSKKTEYGSEEESKSATTKDITSLVQALHEEQPPSEYEDSHIEDTSDSRAVSHNVNDTDSTATASATASASATLNVQPGPPLPKRDHTKPVTTVSNEAENKKEENPDGTIQNISNSWTQSTVYNTALTPGRRRYLFIPSQIFLIVMILISTAVSNVAAGIFCGIIFSIAAAVLSGWIIWSFKSKSLNTFYVMGFYGGEFIAVLLGIIGGFALNRNYVLYVGIPGIIICIAATIIGYLGIIQPWGRAQLTDKDESEIF